MQLKTLFNIGISALNTETPSLDARLLLQHAANISQEIIYLQPDLEISETVANNYLKLIDQRKNNQPVAKIIGSKSFWLDDFIVNNHTLDPRPDSEVIIETAIKLLPNKHNKYKFLDLGTGSGCLLLSLLREFPHSNGLGIDISIEALKVAQANADLLGLSDRTKLTKQNWADSLDEKFDLIISNPPYIPSAEIASLSPEVKFHDPLLALDGGYDGLDPYRYLTKQISLLLKPNAYAIFEFGFGQAEAIRRTFEESGYLIHQMLLDLNNIERAIVIGNE